MNIKDLAVTMSREEFLKHIYENQPGDMGSCSTLKITGESINCPVQVGFPGGCFDEDGHCYACWLEAIENVKFKGEGNDTNNFEIGKIYRVKSIEELKKGNEISNTGQIKSENGNLFFLTPTMDWTCGKEFKYTGGTVKMGEYRIEPWMCEEVNNIAKSTKIDQHMKICNELNNLYERKNHDYGDSFGDTFKKLGIVSAVTRITDKVNRLQSLCTKDSKVDESIKDTLMDAANYCIMTLIELEGER